MVETEIERLLLVPWSNDYFEDLARICSKPEVFQYISREGSLGRSKCREISDRWIRQWEQYGYGPWAALERRSGRWVGEVGLELLEDWPQLDKWEVGWILDPAFWGRGFATEGGREAVRFGFG